MKGEIIQEEFEREASLLSNLRHPNILTFYGICLPNKDQKYMVGKFYLFILFHLFKQFNKWNT